jgi:hypothetical protein
MFSILPQNIIWYILQEYCSKRPDFMKYGWSSHLYLGSGTSPGYYGQTRKSELGIALIAAKEGRKDIIDGSIRQFNIDNNEKNMNSVDKFKSDSDSLLFLDYVPIGDEIAYIIKGVTNFLTFYMNTATLPWHRIEDETKLETLRLAIMRQIGIDVDGSPIRLPWYKQLFYFLTSRGHLEWKLRRIRQKQYEITNQILALGDGELDIRDMCLIQHFILEQVSPFERFSLKKVRSYT